MSKTMRCKRCTGRKIVIGLGGMQKDCPACHGIGHVSAVEDKDEDNFLAETVTEEKKVVKKRGRQPALKQPTVQLGAL